jgi:hypothetical protein
VILLTVFGQQVRSERKGPFSFLFYLTLFLIFSVVLISQFSIILCTLTNIFAGSSNSFLDISAPINLLFLQV